MLVLNQLKSNFAEARTNFFESCTYVALLQKLHNSKESLLKARTTFWACQKESQSITCL